MASQLGALSHSAVIPRRIPVGRSSAKLRRFRFGATASGGGGGSYLDMWKKATDREKKTANFHKIVETSEEMGDNDGCDVLPALEKKSEEFQRILEVSREERDRIQRWQVIDRASAAIAAAKEVLEVNAPPREVDSGELRSGASTGRSRKGRKSWSRIVTPSDPSRNGIPGPDFWSWTPPESESIDIGSDGLDDLQSGLKPLANPDPTPSLPVAEKERSLEILSLLFESILKKKYPPLPPLQSLMEVKMEQEIETLSQEEEHEISLQSSENAAEAAHALEEEVVPYGVTEDGTRWWRETGVEQRPDGVICRWTVTRGISADQTVEWQEKFWEASDEFGYKELGSEKTGRDKTGSVWREYWRESMGQEKGLLFLEKTADKWGKNGNGDEWQEQWHERYKASGETEKSAHKWCSIDPNTELEAGHAHIWHERWGEKYDGNGGSTKYTDKWAEQSEGDGWTKWGDKWDEGFDANANGVKQGETWWEGKGGERWNRTWGERHNGSGWVHKYGKSSSGDHWDTHVDQETWYERFPHFGFYHCFDNSVQLRQVPKPSDMS